MFRRFLHILPFFFFVLAAARLVWGEAPAGDRLATPCPGVLVLHGGQVLQGKIEQTGDLYRVGLPGGEIRIRANSVAYHCATIEEAYGRRRASIRMDSADDHLELARWCQHNGLLGASARELADAMAADPHHPGIPYLERQLNAALAPASAPPTTKTPDLPDREGPTDAELDRLIRQMPPGTVEEFTSAIQPLLLNSCTVSGCHGPASAGRLRLLRSRSGYAPTRRLTQRNLHAVLECIDRKQPGKSPLLVEAARAHGAAVRPPLDEKGLEKIEQIARWVHRVAGAGPSQALAPLATSQAEPGKRTGSPSGTAPVHPWPPSTSGEVRAASFNEPVDSPGAPGPRPREANTAGNNHGDHPSVQRGAKIEQFAPVDPFDPEIFNRRYHSGK